MSETSFILDARQALKDADRVLGEGHVAPLHERDLKARLADLILHASSMEAAIREVWSKPQVQDDSESDPYGGFRPGMHVQFRAMPSGRGVVVAVRRIHDTRGERVTVTTRFEDGRLAHVPPENLQPVPDTLEPAYDQEAVAEKILAFYDDARGRCACQSRSGEMHDMNPPCGRRREAHLLAIRLRPETA